MEVVAPEGWQKPAAVAAAVAPAAKEVPAEHAAPEPVVAATTMAVAVPILVDAPPVSPPAVPPPAPPSAPPVLPAAPLWIKAMVYSALPMAAAMVLAGAWIATAWWPRQSDETDPPVVAADGPNDVPSEPATPATAKADVPALDRRWLPDDTRQILSLVPGPLLSHPAGSRLLGRFEPAWRDRCLAAFKGLGLKPETVRRATLAGVDLAAWPKQGILVIELVDGQSTETLAAAGVATGMKLGDTECRKLPAGGWPHPFAAVAQRTIITGEESLLAELARRSEPKLQSPSLDRLVALMHEPHDALLLVDLKAARQNEGYTLEGAFDVWPEGKAAWHTLWELPDATGVAIRWGEPFDAVASLVCDAESGAERVRAAANEIQPLAKEGVAALRRSLGEKLKAGQLGAKLAEPYDRLLAEAESALAAVQIEQLGNAVTVRLHGTVGTAALAVALVDAREALGDDWLAAARRADEAVHARLLSALVAYQKAEGQWPPGALGGALLPPETRLSWIAGVLPYLGHADWHRKLEPGVAWNSAQNKPVTQLPLPELVNPVFGQGKTAAGFPVTHYVGVAGLGKDAGTLSAKDPRAGMFGFARTTRPQDIPDGAANTIAILGVREQLGAWAAGGSPTVRGLTQRPYVNGPDGFGSGQPNGMVAGMADGSVRFLAKDIDAELFEHLATINGGEKTTIAQFDRDPPAVAKPPADPQRPVIDLKPDEPKPPAPAASQLTKAQIEQRLQMPVARLELNGMALKRAVEMLSAMSAVPIAFDAEALEEFGAAPGEAVSLDVPATTLGGVLDDLAKTQGLIVLREDGCLLITSPAEHRTKLKSWEHSVADLAGAMDMQGLVERFVMPETWLKQGGPGSLKFDAGVLRAEQTEAVWQRAVFFLEKLRAARNRPLQTKIDPEQLTLRSRAQRGRAMLLRTVTANFRDRAPLTEIASYLEDATQTHILIDWPALTAAGFNLKTKATLAVEKQPLARSLNEMLQPLRLTFRVLDADTLEITTPKALAARLDVEFYPVGNLLTRGESAIELIARVKREVYPSSWADARGPGTLYFDPASQCLIVLQTQTAQMAIERLLLSTGM